MNKNSNNALASVFVIAVWLTLLFFVGSRAYRNMCDNMPNFKVKTMEELMNGSP